ncbi:MAG: hypothetical protein RLY86_4474 [Pseudomonadota bacterium]|jgi:hypothetical protein
MSPRPSRSSALLPALLAVGMLLSACTTAKAPAPLPAAPPPVPPPVAVNDIVLTPADEAALKMAMDQIPKAAHNQSIPWTNPATGLTGSVKVLRDGFDARNRACREFHAVVNRDVLFRHSTGVMCQQSPDRWEIVDTKTYPLRRVGGA